MSKASQNAPIVVAIMPSRHWKRVRSTRRWVERAEARLHRGAASLTLAVRDLPEGDVSDIEQKAIRQALNVAETQLRIAMDVCQYIYNRRRKIWKAGTFASHYSTDAKLAQPAEKQEGSTT